MINNIPIKNKYQFSKYPKKHIRGIILESFVDFTLLRDRRKYFFKINLERISVDSASCPICRVLDKRKLRQVEDLKAVLLDRPGFS